MVVHARDALALLFGLTQRRQEQAGQNGNDRDYHQQLNERKGGSVPPEPVRRMDFRTFHLTTPVVATHYARLIASSTSFLAERNQQESIGSVLSLTAGFVIGFLPLAGYGRWMR